MLLAALAPRAEATSTDFGQIQGAVVASGIKSTKLVVTCCTHKFHYTEAASPGSAFAPPIQGVEFTITHDAEDPVPSGKGVFVERQDVAVRQQQRMVLSERIDGEQYAEHESESRASNRSCHCEPLE